MNARFLELEITGRCHYRCKHCYGSFPREGLLAKQTVMQIIDEARKHFDCIIFSGGEPFLHPDLIELTHYAKDFVVFITTSGYSLNREQVEGLPGNVVLVFGIDGIGEVHNYYRGMKGAFEMILRSLDLARQRPKEIIATLWKGIIPQVDELIALAEQYEALLHFNALIPVGRAGSNWEILLSREENEMIYEKLNELRMQRGAFLITDLYKITEKDLKGIDLFCKGFSLSQSAASFQSRKTLLIPDLSSFNDPGPAASAKPDSSVFGEPELTAFDIPGPAATINSGPTSITS